MHPEGATRLLFPCSAHVERGVGLTPKIFSGAKGVVHKVAVDGVAVPSGFVHEQIEPARRAGVFHLGVQVDVVSGAPHA